MKNMTLNGYLSIFSLPEIFQFLEQGHKTGLLTVRTLPVTLTPKDQFHYIWLHQGRIVAAADRLDHKGLVSMIAQRGWVSDKVALRIFQVSPVNTAIGLSLKSQGLVDAEQLKLLFRSQVIGEVCALFQLLDGQFEFDTKASLPSAEMTGLSMPASEATLIGLRTLRNWTALTEKLPEITSGLASKIKGQPQLRLDSLEWQVWEYANGRVSLDRIAQQLRLPTEKVQQIAFRLILTNLAEEIFMVPIDQNAAEKTLVFTDFDEINAFDEPITQPLSSKSKRESIADKSRNGVTPVADKLLEPMVDAANKTNVSNSFLQNLVGFLQAKVAS